MTMILLAAAAAAAAMPLADEAAARQALRALQSLEGIRLASRPSCASAGQDERDRTIGDFMASIMAAAANRTSAGPVLEVRAGPQAEGWVPVEVTVGMIAGGEEWRWGLGFAMRADSGRVKRSSIECLVAG